MQQPQMHMEFNTAPLNTAPRSAVGQFEDADDNDEVAMINFSTVPTRHQATKSPTAMRKTAMSCHLHKTIPSSPSSRGWTRRISGNTSEATKALLAIAGASPPQRRKTFAVRLQEIKEYIERHGRVHRSDPVTTDVQGEQDLLAWVQDCRKKFAAGKLSQEKASAIHALGVEGFRPKQEEVANHGRHFQGSQLISPHHNAHPAMQALWMQRQQEEAQRLLMLQASMGMSVGVPLLPPLQPRKIDPDGTTPTDAQIYPDQSLNKGTLAEKDDPTLQYRNQQPYASTGLIANQMQEMTMQDAVMREARVHGHRQAFGEMQAREALARDAQLRHQLVVQDQRMAQAMAAQQHMSMGAAMAGFGGLNPQFAALASHQRNIQFQHQEQQGRVTALLQPLETVPQRADQSMMAMTGLNYNAPQVSAMLQHQMMQRRASFEAQGAMLRRFSDTNSQVDCFPSCMTYGLAESEAQEQHLRGRKTWVERMQEMKNFFVAHGHTQVQTRGQYRELGRWLSSVRCRLRDGLLPQPLVKEFLDMECWTVKDCQLLKPVDSSRDTSVERDCAAGHDSIRRLPGEDTMLANPRDQPKIEAPAGVSASPKGNIKRALPKSWDHSFEELQQFKARFGHCDVKMIVNSPYGLLGKWLASQRSRHKLGQLPVDKVNRLRQLGASGFASGGKVPQTPHRADDEEAEFDEEGRRLKSDADADAGGGNGSVPHSPDNREKRVRHTYETRLVHIKAFKEKHGHVKIRLGSDDKHEELLARWLASARSRYRGGQFREDRAEELRALGCDGFEIGTIDGNSRIMEKNAAGLNKRDASVRTATPSPSPSTEFDEGEEPAAKRPRRGPHGKRQSFDDMLKELESYQYVYGVGCSVPKPDGESGKLGRWLAFQRRQFIAGKLSADRIESLKSIGRKEFSQSALIVRAAERAAASMHNDQ